jgi:hypothetical protein
LTDFSDIFAVTAATAGASTTVTVPANAHLTGINLCYGETATGYVPAVIELTWTGSPQPLRFVPHAFGETIGTPSGGSYTANSDICIPLDVVVKNATLVTVKATTLGGNVTLKGSIRWQV